MIAYQVMSHKPDFFDPPGFECVSVSSENMTHCCQL